MPARAATPFDLRRISALLESSLHTGEGIVASALPVPLAGGAIGGWRGLMNGLFGLNGRLRIVAGAHLDGAKRSILDALRDVTITHCSETAAVVRSGRSRVLPAINEGRLRAALDCTDSARATGPITP